MGADEALARWRDVTRDTTGQRKLGPDFWNVCSLGSPSESCPWGPVVTLGAE